MEVLLKTKLSAPVIRDRLVARPALLQRLEDGLLLGGEFQRRLTLVAAPAGYGKTTLVASWLRAVGRPFAWLSLDENDNDPSRFLAYLVAAFNQLGVGQAAQGALQAPQPPPGEAILALLVNEIASAGQPVTLAMDDYHAIHNPQVHKLLAFFLEAQPACTHLALMTREDPLLPVPRLRARGEALEIRQEDLRFSSAESLDFLSRVMRLDVGEKEVALLERRTEGWIAGLQLAALALQGIARRGEAPQEFIEDFAGSSRFVIDYLVMEVFEQQPADLQEFLLKTAVVERMTAGLCDALSGRSDSRDLLERMEQANLFLIPLDRAREWYRYHHLFVEFLRHALRERHTATLPGLHGIASRWFEANAFPAEAVEHALAGGDWQRAGDLIDAAKDRLLRAGEIATLLGWYGRLPQELLRARPELALGYAWPLLLSSQLERAEQLLALAEPLIAEGSQRQGDLYAGRAYLARSRGDHAAVIAASERALALLASANPSVRATLAVNLGIAYWHSGQLDLAEKTMADVQREAMQAGNQYALLTASFFLVRVLATRGQLRQAEALYLKLLRESGPTPISALVAYDLGTIYLEWDRLDEAEKQIKTGLEISGRTANAEFLSSGHILNAYLLQARGDPAAALAEAGLALDLARDYPPGVQSRSQALHARLFLALGETGQAQDWAGRRQAGGDAHPFYRFLDLTGPLLLLARGQAPAARDLLAAARQTARQNGWGYGLVAALILLSRAAEGRESALEALGEALRLAEPEGYLRSFFDGGPELVPLLQEALRRGITPAYTAQLLAKMGGEELSAHASAPAQPGLVEPLSERELEVLRLVAAGLSNREIARKLVVTTGTAKTHIHHICGKLGVRNRTEAAMRAKELNLV